MRRVLIFLIIFTTIFSVQKPGIIFRFHKHSLNKLIQLLLPTFNSLISDIQINEPMNFSVIHVFKTALQISPIEKFEYLDHDALISGNLWFEIRDLHFKSQLFCYVEGLFHQPHRTVGRTVNVNGIIKKIAFTVKFSELTEAKNDKPYISLELESMIINNKDIKIDIAGSKIAELVLSKIVGILKIKIFAEANKQMAILMKTTLTDLANYYVDKLYPDIILLGHFDLVLCTKLMGTPRIDKDFIILPIDGTIYDKKIGYQNVPRKLFDEIGEPYNSDFDLLINSHVFRTLLFALSNTKFEYKKQNTKTGIELRSLLPEIEITEEGIHFSKMKIRFEQTSKRHSISFTNEVSMTLAAEIRSTKNTIIDLIVKQLDIPMQKLFFSSPWIRIIGYFFNFSLTQQEGIENQFRASFPRIDLPLNFVVQNIKSRFRKGFIQLNADVETLLTELAMSKIQIDDRI